jgi:tetratricopeptide (TPR) repeat protein
MAEPTPAEKALVRAERRRAQAQQRAYCPIMEVRRRLADGVRAKVVTLLLEENPDDAAMAERILRHDEATEDDPDALDLLGYALKNQGKFEEAKDATERGIRLKNARSLAQIAAIHFDLGQVAAGVTAAEHAVDCNGCIPQAWANYLHGLAKQRDYSALDAVWQRMKAEFPDWRRNPVLVDQLERDIVMVLAADGHAIRNIILDIEETRS